MAFKRSAVRSRLSPPNINSLSISKVDKLFFCMQKTTRKPSWFSDSLSDVRRTKTSFDVEYNSGLETAKGHIERKTFKMNDTHSLSHTK